jgi:hypothetical protein
MGNSSDAKAGQDVVEGEQKQWTETVETTWKVAQSSADLLLKYAPQDATQRSLVAARLSDQQEQMIIETTTTLITGVIGSLPIPGAGLIADAYGLLLGWITGAGQTDPWKELEDSLKKYMAEAVLGLELNTLKNDMADIERKFDSFCKDRKKSNWKPGDTLNSELETRLISCYNGVQRIQKSLYNPYSPKHTTLPYFERYCTLHFAIMSSVVGCLTSYNIQREYDAFFNETYAYLNGAYSSSRVAKESNIKRKRGGILRHEHYVVDEGITDLTKWWILPADRHCLFTYQHRYLQTLVPYYFQCQLGLHRMFASYDSLVKIYNEKVGKNLPLLVPVLDRELPGLLNTLHQYMDKITRMGFDDPGILYNLYHRRSIEELKGPIFYEDLNWSGKSVQLTVGSYPDITKQGIADNSITSVKVPSRWKITLYPEKDFKGQPTVLRDHSTSFVLDSSSFTPYFNLLHKPIIDSNNAAYANIQDKTSSIKVEVDICQ